MRGTALMLLAVLVAGCAGPSARDDDAQRRLQAERDLERECRRAAMTNTYNPRCPQPEPQRAPGAEPIEPPRLPDVRLPGG
jgi:hypothetical protein